MDSRQLYGCLVKTEERTFLFQIKVTEQKKKEKNVVKN
jgi:hypothetical protein